MKIYYSNIHDHSIADLLPLVSQDRRQASLKYRFDDDKKRSLLAHVLLSYALKKDGYDITLPAAPVTDANGKPHLYDKTGEIYFSLSHSGKYAVCAIADSPVGVDIEEIKENRPEIARRFFNPEELKYISDAESFYRIWTLKEGYLKAVGLGMRLPLDSFIINGLDPLTGKCIYLNENRSETGLSGLSHITEDGYALSVTCRSLPAGGLMSVCRFISDNSILNCLI